MMYRKLFSGMPCYGSMVLSCKKGNTSGSVRLYSTEESEQNQKLASQIESNGKYSTQKITRFRVEPNLTELHRVLIIPILCLLASETTRFQAGSVDK